MFKLCLIDLKKAKKQPNVGSNSRFYLCNISTHLKCCVSAAYLEEEAMRGFPLTFFFYWYELVIVLHLRPKLFFLFDVLALFSCHKHSWKKRERATVSCRSFTNLHSSVAMNDCFCRIYKHNSRKITHRWFAHEGNIPTRLKLVRLIQWHKWRQFGVETVE